MMKISTTCTSEILPFPGERLAASLRGVRAVSGMVSLTAESSVCDSR